MKIDTKLTVVDLPYDYVSGPRTTLLTMSLKEWGEEGFSLTSVTPLEYVTSANSITLRRVLLTYERRTGEPR